MKYISKIFLFIFLIINENGFSQTVFLNTDDIEAILVINSSTSIDTTTMVSIEVKKQF